MLLADETRNLFIYIDSANAVHLFSISLTKSPCVAALVSPSGWLRVPIIAVMPTKLGLRRKRSKAPRYGKGVMVFLILGYAWRRCSDGQHNGGFTYAAR